MSVIVFRGKNPRFKFSKSLYFQSKSKREVTEGPPLKVPLLGTYLPFAT